MKLTETLFDPEHYNEESGLGYYDFERHGTRWRITKYVDVEITELYKVNNMLGVLFADQNDKWWIGSYWKADQELFETMGPFDTSEDAWIMLALVGVK